MPKLFIFKAFSNLGYKLHFIVKLENFEGDKGNLAHR